MNVEHHVPTDVIEHDTEGDCVCGPTLIVSRLPGEPALLIHNCLAISRVYNLDTGEPL